MALFHTELSRDGPGLMLRDILGSGDQVEAIADLVQAIDPDVLVLADIDYDLNAAGLNALADQIGGYPHRFTRAPNRGLPSGRDLNGDGRIGGPEDAEGYAEFPGQGGMAVLSRYPFDVARFRDFSAYEWADMPGNLALGDGRDPRRLSTTVHWDLPITLGLGSTLSLLIWHGTAPVFDGPEDRNGRRNHDETAFWLAYLNGDLHPEPPDNFVLLGVANADPFDGESRSGALRSLLDDPRITDPKPASAGARDAANDAHSGPAQLDTVDWPDGAGQPGNLRVDYVLPAAHLQVTDSGVFWPREDALVGEQVRRASRHRLVWVDIEMGNGLPDSD